MSDYTIETRRRSRSKTPFLRSTCDHENCEYIGDEPHAHHHKKKSPTVRTIMEETVEVTSSSSVGTEKPGASKMSQTKIRTSSEGSPENKHKIASRTLISSAVANSQKEKQTVTRTSTTVVTKSKSIGNDSVATSTPKTSNYITSFASQFVSGGKGSSRANIDLSNNEVQYQQQQQHHIHKEQTQNILNAEKELSNSKKNFLSGFFSKSFGEKSVNSETSEHIAYLEYKNAGEYWKKTPKTDYTYSKFSPHRRVLADGTVSMPNMSRQSLENHNDRISYMVQRNPAQEDHIRRRYESPKYSQYRTETERLTYDSGDEVDYLQNQSYRNTRLYNNYEAKQDKTWLMRLITTIVTTITTVCSTITGSGRNDTVYNSSTYHVLDDEERGFFGSIAHGITSGFLAIVRNIYLFISSVLYLDTWLLQSSNAGNENKKRFLLFLLILLPLLLIAAWWLSDEQDRIGFAQHLHSMVPLPLIATLRSSLYTNFHALKSFLPLFTSSTHSTSQNIENLKSSLSKSMPPEEYENILNHINSYINKLVDIKLKEQQQHEKSSSELNTKQVQLIVQIIKENLEALSRQKRFTDGGSDTLLSDNDMNVIIEKLLLKLNDSPNFATPRTLSPENIEEIRKLITQTIEFNNSHEHYKLIVEKLDLDALIAKLLKAPAFGNYIQSEIAAQLNDQIHEKLLILQQSQTSGDDHDHYKLNLEQQMLLIDNLNKDIAFVKLSLNDKLSENEDLHYSIKQLQQTQDVLLQRLQELESANDQKFAKLLQDITIKLNNLKDDQFKLLNQQVKLSLIEILGFKKEATKDGGAQLSEQDLQNWVHNMFVAKDYLELRLADINNRTNDKIKQEIDKSGMFLMRDISERLKQEIILSVENKQKETRAVLKGEINEALSEQEVRNIVKSVLAIYDADKTGLVDFALESAGGQILSTRCTESYQTKTAQISVFGIPLWYPTNTPRIAISPNVQPGECWAFQGFPGFLILKLNSLVYVTGFTLEHIPKSLAPNGRIDSAPKNFTVWGLEHEKDQEPILFGEYEYADNDASLQYYPLQNKNIKRPYEIVELRIESNHGHPQYTCLYRFRVHGKPPAV